MHEVAEAVKRANLKVDTVFAMHHELMPWDQVIALFEKSQDNGDPIGESP